MSKSEVLGLSHNTLVDKPLAFAFWEGKMNTLEQLLWSISPSLVPCEQVICAQCRCGKAEYIEQEFEKGWHYLDGEWFCLKCAARKVYDVRH